MSSSEEESNSGSNNSGTEQSSSENSSGSGSGSGSGSDNSGSGSDNSSNSGSGSGSDSNSSNSDDSSNDSSNSDSNSDSSNDSDKKNKKVKKSKDPFINAMSTLQDVLGELDSIASSVDMISMRSGTSKPINWYPPAPPKYEGPPKNYYAPGLCAGETPKRKNRSKKRIVRVVESEESTVRDDESETVESDIAPTLSHNGTDNVLPYCEPRAADERFNMPPR